MKKFSFLLVVLFLSVFAFAQDSEPKTSTDYVSMTARLEPADIRPGEYGQIIIEAKIQPGWHIFGSRLEGDWVNVGISVPDEQMILTSAGEQIDPAGLVKNVPGFDKPGVWYEEAVAFAYPVQASADGPGEVRLLVPVRVQACDDTSCDRPWNLELPLEFTVGSGDVRPEYAEPNLSVPEQPEGYVAPPADQSSDNLDKPRGDLPPKDGEESPGGIDEEINKAKEKGWLSFVLLSFGAGLLALLTPCVWPMIPITVSYFSKTAEEGKSPLPYALAYALGMVITFVGLGLILTLALGASGAQSLAANVWVNLGLAILFIVLAANLFGVFEIFVPQGVINNLQTKSRSKAGFIAPILLGLVFSLTTFTCTVPFIGTILVSATSGEFFYPILGMLSFSLAFALPFFGLAMAPSALNKLPKSGNWLNAVKAYLGFIELAAALKFLSNVDLTFAWRFLTMPVYLALWVAIFLTAALYLLGVVKLPHDDGSQIGIGRKIFGFVNIGIAGFLLMAINNSGLLGSAVAFAPPDPYPGTASHAVELPWILDYEEGMAKAKEEGKPV
ncbi:MAG: hypothetical protein KDC26_11975, partial [Armatimonadetes bacterium]|nr:hypothetical protein [Armatimonadota bacterium]